MDITIIIIILYLKIKIIKIWNIMNIILFKIDDDYLDNFKCNTNDKTCYTIPVFCSINDFYINIKNYLIQKYQ